MRLAFPDPALSADAIVLRRPVPGDIPWITAACGDRELSRNIPAIPYPYSESDARAFLEHADRAWAEGSGAVFVIARAAGGEGLGTIGLQLSADDAGLAAVGYWLCREARGQGAATIAVRLVSRWAFDELGIERLNLITAPENLASQRVARRAGFTREGLVRAWLPTPDGRRDCVLFSLLPDDQPVAAEPASEDPVGARYPNTARIWNYQLGGKDNFAVDREASEAANAMVRELGVPAGAETAVESRHLLQRMVDYMLSQGVRQFLDLGSGLPNMANTHQIAHRVSPEARVVYVDKDPLVSTHAAALMAGPNVVTIRADLREPEQVLGNTQVRDLLDFGQPVGIMFMCVLHCLWDEEDPWGVVGLFRDAVAPGSYLALSHMTGEAHPEAAAGLFRISQDLHWDTPLISRDRTAITRYFDGFTLIEPGLAAPAQWRPDLHDPLRDSGDPDGGEPVLSIPEPLTDDRGVAWHLCGVGIKSSASGT